MIMNTRNFHDEYEVTESTLDRLTRIADEAQREAVERMHARHAENEKKRTEGQRLAKEHGIKMGRPGKYGFGSIKNFEFANRIDYYRAVIAARGWGKRNGIKFTTRWDRAVNKGYITQLNVP